MAIALEKPGDLRLDWRGRAVFSLSPAWRKTGERRNSCIWHVAPGKAPARLTNGPGCDKAPAPSPVDERIAFLSDRVEPGRFSPYMIEGENVRGALCPHPGTVEKIVWSRDGAALFLLVADEALDGASCDGALPLAWGPREDPEVMDGRPMRRLLRLDLPTGATRELNAGGFSVWDFDVGPEESVIAVASEDPTERGWHEARLVRMNHDGCKTLYTPAEPIQCPAISPSGKIALLLEGPASDRNLVAGTLRLIDLSNGGTLPFAADQLDDLTHATWLCDTQIGFAGWMTFGCRYGRISTDGQVLSDHCEAAQLGPRRFAARVEQGAAHDMTIRESTGSPPEIVLRAGDTWHPLTAFNAGAADAVPRHDTIRVEWRAPDGEKVAGLLLDPGGAAPGPLVVVVHGGPTASVRSIFDPANALQYVAAGYRVLLPNYRGSVGRGQAFARAVIGDPAGADWADVLSGVDHVISLGLADRDRIGITGSSYGGYLSAWAAAVSDRFAAAVVVSGISDLLACNYDCNHAFSEWVAGGPVTEARVRDLLLARSPLHNLDPATTPTLFLHGQRDRCTPVTQSRMMYRALRRRGTRARQVVFPREGHMIEEAEHRERLRKEALDWFGTYLGGPA